MADVSIERAEGMLAAIRATHECGVACTSTVTLGDGSKITLHCPWYGLDLSNAVDRRIVQTVYANEAAHAAQIRKAAS